jgi:transcriptional regulator with XRE-family HTH domain
MKVGIYKTYLFRNKDPVIDELRTLIQDEGLSYQDIHVKSGVSVTTLRNWFHGETRRPQSPTVEAVGRACGKMRVWVDMKRKKK